MFKILGALLDEYKGCLLLGKAHDIEGTVNYIYFGDFCMLYVRHKIIILAWLLVVSLFFANILGILDSD